MTIIAHVGLGIKTSTKKKKKMKTTIRGRGMNVLASSILSAYESERAIIMHVCGGVVCWCKCHSIFFKIMREIYVMND